MPDYMCVALFISAYDKHYVYQMSRGVTAFSPRFLTRSHFSKPTKNDQQIPLHHFLSMVFFTFLHLSIDSQRFSPCSHPFSCGDPGQLPPGPTEPALRRLCGGRAPAGGALDALDALAGWARWPFCHRGYPQSSSILMVCSIVNL